MLSPVDAVITWVDGSDINHVNKLNNYLASISNYDHEAAAPTRFQQHGELNYCVRSIRRFAPWINNIYIVTDEQTPQIIDHNKIKIVDHKEIFAGFEHYLPTFNSLAIESVLWRIPNLAEKFIYFNDDCAIIRPITAEDFFQNDKVVLRGKWKLQTNAKLLPSYKPNLHRNWQEEGAKLAGLQKKFFHLPHEPFALRKSTLEFFFNKYPELLEQNIKFPLRNLQQFLPVSLSNHLEIQNNNVIFDKYLRAIYLHGGSHNFRKIRSRLREAQLNANIAFICMQSIDEAPVHTRNYMLEWLEQRIS